jgi:L-cysteate sulfo-lyase
MVNSINSLTISAGDMSLELPARHSLIQSPTPIDRLLRLEQLPEIKNANVRLFVKRDDSMSLGGGGNKLRKLEFLIADALATGCDTFITVGVLQSNHARLSAAACARAGLDCELVLAGTLPIDDREYQNNGNILLDEIFGARVHRLKEGDDPLSGALALADELRNLGRRPYVVRGGGSTPLGAIGYAVCAAEIADYEREHDLAFARIVLPNGGSGTHAGLCMGFAALGLGVARLKAFSVIRSATDAKRITHDLAVEAAKIVGAKQVVQADDIHIDDTQLGERYGVPTAAAMSAIRTLARTEGILLDPVYSGKAFAGFLDDINNRLYNPGDSILFIMTGGMPSLFAYRSVFNEIV